ncbi:4Fe-4S dicluster domain-containing protein [Geomonas subterranea]|uniref:4Fe-4S dicluster domain-containing protein n=1 Tax=Geomonas subterranea TaxID=2847989 RepID=A0ABX8LHV0_9BACT|nr:4Fe-4S dicluster domain-containing protein [Geomonas subterranea]QXE89934.1 4Fe-4S dicluster domain-containing protein [Geomonas subterranea]QXM07947.1 4Fe-4S dicluster domain-containing protein [Geomonas subterranea]
MSEMSRRTFLWITGGSSIALATDTPRKLVNKLIPKVTPPEEISPGDWTYYATTCRECPAGCGMHVANRDGRATKAEGNPGHPVNRGALCPRGQSSLQGLFDPDRVTRVLYRSGRKLREKSWQEAFTSISTRLASGGRVALLSSLQTGALAEVLHAFTATFGSDRLLFYEPFNYESLRAAHQQLFGLPVIPRYDLEGSDFILSFAADFLETWGSPVRQARQFSDARGYREGESPARMAYLGPRLSMTASNADRFVQASPEQIPVLAAALLKVVLDRGWYRNDPGPVRPALDALIKSSPLPALDQELLVTLAREFTSARRPVALTGPQYAGGSAGTDTALCVALLNYAVGAIGTTVDFSRPHALSLSARAAELDLFFASLGPQDVLFVLDANPAYCRTGAAEQMTRAGMVVYLGTQLDETAELARWVLPTDTPLESWGEYQPEPGVDGLMQPVMGRLHDTRGAGDILIALARLAGRPLKTARGTAPADLLAWLKERRGLSGGEQAEQAWQAALRKGGAWQETPPPAGTGPAPNLAGFSLHAPLPGPARAEDVELWPWASIMLYDGRQANRGWLQEAPDPITFIVWGNWIDLHPKKAALLGIEDGDLAQLTSHAGSLRAPVRLTREVEERTAAIGLGQGHSALGQNARGVGSNVFLLLDAVQRAGFFTPCRVSRVAGNAPRPIRTALQREQLHRDLLQSVPLSVLRSGNAPPEAFDLPLPEGYHEDHDLYPRHEHLKHRWAMVVDLQRCIGCGACAVACYAENNVPVIGPELVADGREMAWLRVPPYRVPGSPWRYAWLPLHCQHCDAAPCEPVCPVFAAVHNEEGLNAQIYNRCIGTRYCSNNCPYKVRRFNWVNLEWRKPLDLQLNPEVTVRQRGVMEKCTFCVQRIRQAQYRAAREGRKLKDGEVVPACAQTCPARVFTFGDLLDPGAQVTRLTRGDPRRYHLLHELNTKPAVTFLRRVENDVV